MTTIIKFNKKNEFVTVSNSEIMKKTSNLELISYLKIREKYSIFCNNQTKKGQSRKNERARIRKSMFLKTETEFLDKELLTISKEIAAEKDSLIEKVSINIEFDGRKVKSLSSMDRLIEGVKMAYFTGGISPQYYSLGLISFEIIN